MGLFNFYSKIAKPSLHFKPNLKNNDGFISVKMINLYSNSRF